MPINRKIYPPHWNDISRDVRERAGWQCEWCKAKDGSLHPTTRATVVLQVAHIENPDPMDCRDENLACLCQVCHLRYDAKLHAISRAWTRLRRQVEAGQLLLIPLESTTRWNAFLQTAPRTHLAWTV